MARPQKPPGEKRDKAIRLPVNDAEKAAFERLAIEDGFETMAQWLKWLIKRREREQSRERGTN